MSMNLNRRGFVGTAASALTIVPRHVLGGTGYVAPSDKITLAHVGFGFQSISEISSLLACPDIQIVAVCDPNRSSNDYVEWSKGGARNRVRQLMGNPNWQANQTGCPGGREVGRELIDTYYAKQRGVDRFRAVKTYADFREMFEKEKDITAVKVMTPDHLHATISIAAMKRGKHVVMHKPLSNRMYEARLVIETARQTKVATHFLPYGAGEGNRRICARIKEGAIGKLVEIHNWSNRPVWPQYAELPKETPPVPPGFDWDLWLGPAVDRPYHPCYTHATFRGWYDFGGGSMADMGIYSLWPVFTELGLDAPVSAQAWATHACNIVDQVSRPIKNDYSYPIGCGIRFKFATPAPELYWYDGGMLPRMPGVLEAGGYEFPIEGIFYIGSEGIISAGFNGQSPILWAKGKQAPLFPEEPQPARRTQTGERPLVFLDAFKGGPQSPGSFLNAGGISQAVCLGTVALRTGKKVLYDSASMKITNVAEANKYLVREYRKGWEL